MKLVWHIIRKDIRRMAWAFVFWAVTGSYLIFYRNVNIVDRSLLDNLGIVSLFSAIALSFALIAAIVQEDGLTGSNEFWRTRPISPGRLLVAKLGLIVPCFVVFTVFVLVLQSWLFHPRFGLPEMKNSLLIFGVIVLCCMALAACTKDLGRYFLGGILCLMGVTMLGPWLVSLAHVGPIPKQVPMKVAFARMSVLFTFCGCMSVVLLLNQYFTRRTRVSLAIVIATVGCVTLVNAFWRWSLL